MYKVPNEAFEKTLKIRSRIGGNKQDLKQAYQLLGDFHYYVWDSLKQAKSYYDSALALNPNSEIRNQMLGNISYIENENNNPREAIDIVNRIIEDVRKTDTVSYYKLLSRKGYSFYLLYQWDSSLANMNKALAGFEAMQDKGQILRTINGIALVLANAGDEISARNYLLDAFIRAREEKDTVLMRPLANNLSIRYEKLGQLDSSRLFAEYNLVFSQSVGLLSGILRGYASLARVALLQKDFAQVHYNADLVLENKNLKDLQYVTTISSVLGYKAEALMLENRLDEALQWAMKNLNYARDNHLELYQADAEKLLYRIYKSRNEPTLALAYLESANSKLDSIKSAENFKAVQELNVKYETERRSREINELEKKNAIQELTITQQRTNVIIISAFVIILIMIGFLYFRSRIFREKARREQVKQKLLRSQLNPHFLYNAMNAIQFVILEDASQHKASDYVAKFAQLTRQILEYSNEELITLEEEVSFLANYLEIQQLRFKEPFNFKIDLKVETDPDQLLLPPMLTQPFVENAIEHALNKKGADGIINIQIEEESDLLLIIIDDNGSGRRISAEQKNHKSMATQITQERIATIRKLKGEKVLFEIQDLVDSNTAPSGTRVIFKLPINKDL